MLVQQVEERVLRLVRHVLNGGFVEDSLVECKAGYPEVEKARQVAAHANCAHGENIIWIIGLDENNHRLSEYAQGVEPASWWRSLEKRFDQNVCPELIHSITVPVDDDGAVLALVFDTSRAPYVIKVNAPGGVEREVPIRVGTGTRTARRSDLVSMLVPVIAVPNASFVDGSIQAFQMEGSNDVETGVSIFGGVRIFFSYNSGAPVFLPLHRMHLRLTFADSVGRASEFLDASPEIYVSNKSVPVSHYGVQRRGDGFNVVGSGLQALNIRMDGAPESSTSGIFSAERVSLLVVMPVEDTRRQLRIHGSLVRVDAGPPSVAAYSRVARWELRVPVDQYDWDGSAGSV